MNGPADRSDTASRRRFLQWSAAAPVVTLQAVPASAQAPAAAASAAPGAAPAAYLFFNSGESAVVEALVDLLIPKDELGPGALQAGVPFYIDHQLAGAWGQMARAYRGGPWQAGSPQQGWQLALTPAMAFRAGLEQLDRVCRAAHAGNSFDQLAAPERLVMLQAMESGSLAFDVLPSQTFFELLYQATMEGFFSDPIYGGNADKVGWRLVGFPGAAAAYIGVIENHGQPYEVEPVSLADLQSGAVDNDGAGHAIHQPRRSR